MNTRLWGVVPAAGTGSRMNSPRPKQYLQLTDLTILELSVQKLLALSQLEAVMVVCSTHDRYFDSTGLPALSRVHRCGGGSERWQSVLNGIDALISSLGAAGDDWLLVHDAARPCISRKSLDALSGLVGSVPVGAILACPVADTLKHTDLSSHLINKTVARQHLWQAHTPQMFPLALLKNSLLYAQSQSYPVTDESSAVEYYLASSDNDTGVTGLSRDAKVQVVPDRRDNIKVTHPEDLALARSILANNADL